MKTVRSKDQEEFIKRQYSHTDLNNDYNISPWWDELFTRYNRYLVPPILDVGTRNGMILKKLGEMKLDCVGVEITDMAKLGQADNRPILQLDIQNKTEFADKQFRTVLMGHVLEHLDRPEDALREIKRIASGKVFIHLPLQGDGEKEIEFNLERFGHHTFFTGLTDLVDFLEKNDFKVIEVGEFNPNSQFILCQI